eukprot:420750_1
MAQSPKIRNFNENYLQSNLMSEPLEQLKPLEPAPLKETTNELALIRTYLACERTFLASIRTNSIFAGLSLLLTTNDQEISSMRETKDFTFVVIYFLFDIVND